MLKVFNINHLTSIFSIVFGLLIFLYGIKLMSSSFKNIVSINVKHKIDRLTRNKLISLLIGVIITALLQSSSATTLIVISLVHGGIISLYKAAPMIMGANIGTTITAQLVAFKVDDLTPYIFVLGIFLTIVLNKTKYKSISKSLLGLSMLFGGIKLMSLAILTLKVSSEFTFIIMNLSNNNLLAILVGFLITAIIQSSSTGIAMLQIMAASNLIPLSTAIFVMLGENIGTCVNTLLGSLATNKEGKQGAIIHILFNILGVIIFYFIKDFIFKYLLINSPNNPSKQLADAHTIFNITTALILLPFSGLLVKIAKKIIRE